MARRGRPKSANAMVHTAVLLPKAMLEELRAEGAKANRSLSAELRYRIKRFPGASPFSFRVMDTPFGKPEIEVCRTTSGLVPASVTHSASKVQAPITRVICHIPIVNGDVSEAQCYAEIIIAALEAL